MARRSQYQPKKPSKSTRSQHGRSSHGSSDKSGIKIGRWVLLILVLLGVFKYFGGNFNTGGIDSGSSYVQVAKSSLEIDLSSKNDTQPNQKQEEFKGGLEKQITPDLWRQKRVQLGQGFVVDKYFIPNQKKQWELIFQKNDSSVFFNDTLSDFLGEVWALSKPGQKVVLKLLKNSKGKIQAFDWKSGNYNGTWYEQDSTWLNKRGCIRGKICPFEPLVDSRVQIAKGLYKKELWRSDSTMEVKSPIEGFLTKYDNIPKKGRLLQIENDAGEKVIILGLGNVAAGLHEGSKIHAGMNLGTLLHQKKTLEIEYFSQGIAKYLSKILSQRISKKEIEKRQKKLSDLLSRG